MDFRKSYELMWGGELAGFVLMLTGGALAVRWLLVIGGVVFLAAVFQTFLFFRCPHCGGSWDVRSGIPRCCPACGAHIQ